MFKFVLALVFVAALEAFVLWFAVNQFVQASEGTGALSIRLLLVTALAILLPPLLVVGVWRRLRADRVRNAEVARYRAISPDSVVFGAHATDAFILTLNRIRSVSGTPPLGKSKMPFVVSISDFFMSVRQTGGDRSEGNAISLLTSMIADARAATVVHPMPGTRKTVRMETVCLRIAGLELDLVIPVATEGLGATTRAEVEAIAARISATIGLDTRV